MFRTMSPLIQKLARPWRVQDQPFHWSRRRTRRLKWRPHSESKATRTSQQDHHARADRDRVGRLQFLVLIASADTASKRSGSIQHSFKNTSQHRARNHRHQNPIRTPQKEIRQLADQTHDLQHARDELLAQRNQMRHELESHALPAATMQRVTRLMETHQLRVIESQQDSGAASQAEKVLKSVQDLLKDDPSTKSKFAHDHTHGHTHHSPTSHHQAHHAHSHDGHTHFEREVYKLKVRGRFQDLQAALEALAAELEHVMPLSLQMEPMELDSSEARQSQRVWTLTIMV